MREPRKRNPFFIARNPFSFRGIPSHGGRGLAIAPLERFIVLPSLLTTEITSACRYCTVSFDKLGYLGMQVRDDKAYKQPACLHLREELRVIIVEPRSRSDRTSMVLET